MATVLIVDDHPAFRSSARRLLEADGHKVVGEAADGLHAVAAATALAPDVVLLDVALPDVDGFEVARALRGGPAVILTSSRDWSDVTALIAETGARGFVAKDDLSGSVIDELLA